MVEGGRTHNCFRSVVYLSSHVNISSIWRETLPVSVPTATMKLPSTVCAAIATAVTAEVLVIQATQSNLSVVSLNDHTLAHLSLPAVAKMFRVRIGAQSALRIIRECPLGSQHCNVKEVDVSIESGLWGVIDHTVHWRSRPNTQQIPPGG